MLNVDVQQLADLIVRTVRETVREELAKHSAAEGAAEFLDMDGACALTGFRHTTIRAWMKAGKVRRYGKGRGLRLKRSELLAVLDSMKARVGGDSAAETRDFAARVLKRGAH